MRILHIIGNGFDLNLGLKTSYKDFLDYYKKLPSSTDTIQKLKESMDDTIIDWSDMELALGKYSKKVDSNDDFDLIHSDIVENLSVYLKNQEAFLGFNQDNRKELGNYLLSPENQLMPIDRVNIEQYKKKFKGTPDEVDIITFNYTHTLEQILGGEANIQLPRISNVPSYVRQIVHIHGSINDRMVLGVNDESQIANNSFKIDQSTKDFLIKRDCYIAAKTIIDDECRKLISEAHLICVFGSSFGATDNYWWEFLGEKIINDIRLIIFYKGIIISPTRSYLIAKQDREYLKKNLAAFKFENLADDNKVNLLKKVILMNNSKMFNLTHPDFL